jgi:toxin CcdB
MPHFAVYANPGRNEAIPFVVQIQSTRLDRSLGRVVMPLVRRGEGAPPDHALTPHLVVQGHAVYANPLDIATVPAARLKYVLAILPDGDQDRIMQAIDEMASRA